MDSLKTHISSYLFRLHSPKTSDELLFLSVSEEDSVGDVSGDVPLVRLALLVLTVRSWDRLDWSCRQPSQAIRLTVMTVKDRT